jgi:sugar lactone lactonase YvrE
MTSNWRFTASPLAIAVALAACGHRAPEDDTATAQFALQQAPSDAVCVQITVTGSTRAVTRSFNPTLGQSTSSLTASGLPTGAVVITGNAYGLLCGQVVSSSQVTWLVNPLSATFLAAGPNAVTLTLTRNGQATISIDFQDDQRTVSTLAGTAGAVGSTDGIGAAARFNNPEGLALDGSGNLFITENGDGAVRQLVVSTGAVTTIAGSLTASGYADGPALSARFSSLRGIAFDAGALWLCDGGNNVIRKLTVGTGATVSTVAGSTAAGEVDGVGTAAQLNYPGGLAPDGQGNLIVADFFGNTVRKVVESSGVAVTIAGTPTAGTADGTGAAARFNRPAWVAVDAAGAIYVSDSNNNTGRKL